MTNFPQVTLNMDLSDGLCFCCGKNNPIGLKLNFHREGSVVKAEFIPQKLHQGWPGILHGGIIACLLDEAMTYAARLAAGVNCLTAKLEIEIKQPAPIEAVFVITSTVVKRTRKLIETEARVLLRDGTLIAISHAKQFVVGTAASAGGEFPVNA